MPFHLRRIREEIAAAPLASPYLADLAAAILNDVFRRAGLPPVPDAEVASWKRQKAWTEKLGMIAHFLAVTSLGDEAVAALAAAGRAEATAIARALREAIAPVTAEMIRANAFRQEEVLRRFIALVGGSIAGETPGESARRLDALDFRKAMAEYDAAEKLRKQEADRREKQLKEALEREAAARGWRE